MLINNVTYRRVVAYLFDFMFMTFLVGLFSELTIINPFYDEYIEVSENYIEYVESVEDGNDEVSLETMEQYVYDITYYSVFSSIITVVINFLYLVVFQYFNKGQTIGKALYKIRVQSKDGKKVKFHQLLLRYLILNSILLTIISIIITFTFPMKLCVSSLSLLQSATNVLFIVCVVMVIFSKDHRGFHDIVGCTKIKDENPYKSVKISYKKYNNEDNNDII